MRDSVKHYVLYNSTFALNGAIANVDFFDLDRNLYGKQL